MVKMLETKIGGTSSFALWLAAEREARGDMPHLIREEVHQNIKMTDDDEGQFAEAVRVLDREKIIEAAVDEFRDSYSDLLNKSLDQLIDEYEV